MRPGWAACQACKTTCCGPPARWGSRAARVAPRALAHAHRTERAFDVHNPTQMQAGQPGRQGGPQLRQRRLRAVPQRQRQGGPQQQMRVQLVCMRGHMWPAHTSMRVCQSKRVTGSTPRPAPACLLLTSDSTCSFQLLLTPPAPSNSPPATGRGQVPGLCAEAGGGALRHLLRPHPLDAGGCSRAGGLAGASGLGRDAVGGGGGYGSVPAPVPAPAALPFHSAPAWVGAASPRTFQRTSRLCVCRIPSPWTSSMSGSTARPPASRPTCLVSGEAAGRDGRAGQRQSTAHRLGQRHPPMHQPLSAAKQWAGTHHLQLCLLICRADWLPSHLPPLPLAQPST